MLRRLQADPGRRPDAGLGLHFDLTVPFARYVLEHAGKLEFPFRRYQIQKVWRGERPQEGRYREFTQADIDIVGRDILAFHHDVEVARVMAEALVALPCPPLRLQVNNRKLIQGFYAGIGVADTDAVDARRRQARQAAGRRRSPTLLVDEAGLDPGAGRRVPPARRDPRTDASFVDEVRGLGVNDELLDEGLEELAAVLEGCAT